MIEEMNPVVKTQCAKAATEIFKEHKYANDETMRLSGAYKIIFDNSPDWLKNDLSERIRWKGPCDSMTKSKVSDKRSRKGTEMLPVVKGKAEMWFL